MIIDINELRKLIDKAEEKQNRLLELYRQGERSDENNRAFNLLLFAINDAYKLIEKQL